jgi:SAM-dependent methyltransferase
VRGDLFSNSLPANSFDLVHERLVLVLQADPVPMLAEMMKLARPGGVVAVEDIDDCSWTCYPHLEAWDVLLKAVQTAFKTGGVDVFVGRRLTGLLQDAGLVEVDGEVHVRLARVGEYRRGHLVSLVESLREKLLEQGIFKPAELELLKRAVRDHLDKPTTLVIRQLLCQAWGRKPAESVTDQPVIR